MGVFAMNNIPSKNIETKKSSNIYHNIEIDSKRINFSDVIDCSHYSFGGCYGKI